MVSPEPRRHEQTDADARWLFELASALVVLAALVLALTWILYVALTPRPEALLTDREERPRPLRGPQLEISPRSELERDLAREKQLLESYDWVDRASGRVRIPIERAIELVAERGLPVREKGGDR